MDQTTSTVRARRGFSDLPDELKLHILRFALVLDHRITSLNYRNHEDDMNLVGLLRTSKSMRNLAAEVYYGSNTFIIRYSPGDSVDRERGNNLAWRYPLFVFGHWVRKLELHILILSRTKSAMQLLEPSHDRKRPNNWLTLLRPRRVLGEHAESDWQSHFSGLSDMKIRIIGRVIMPLEARQEFQSLPEHATIELRPRRVEVEVADIKPNPTSNYTGLEPVSEKLIRDTIRGVVRLRGN